jgi:hypothetical protein
MSANVEILCPKVKVDPLAAVKGKWVQMCVPTLPSWTKMLLGYNIFWVKYVFGPYILRCSQE